MAPLWPATFRPSKVRSCHNRVIYGQMLPWLPPRLQRPTFSSSSIW
ncbi:hypothetical protein HRUBRA_02803 [Pseudohaliea rubra DSM 19751]|uniref:Uncharacterized protein n=1 Tax=Pseudohaliea rubra DSM 19751 TaxID=1265313 RepID=A0A095VN65_9GAMM|nr:hypothetical protein HRUBRA_02803 [Pseudohaliea rubra DSM 19751]